MSRYRSRHHYSITAAVAAVALAVAAAGPAQARSTPGTRVAHPTAHLTVAHVSPEAAAMATAKATHRPVAIPSKTTELSTTVANPSGSLTTTTHVLPVRVNRDGAWRPVSATLQRTAAGTFSPAAAPSGVTLSAGGRGPLATLSSADGHRVSISFPGQLPRPVVAGNTATYRSVLPGVDLKVIVDTLGGISTTLVLHDAAAAANPALRTLRLPVATSGLRAGADAAGNLAITGPRGRPEFSSPPPAIWDSARQRASDRRDGADAVSATSSVAGPGAGAHVGRVALRVLGGALALTPDRALMSRTASYPAYLSDTITPDTAGCDSTQENEEESCQNGFVETQSGCPDNQNWDNEQGLSGYYGNGVGLQDFSPPSCDGTYRAFYQFDTAPLSPDMHILSANLYAWDNYGADWSCSDKWGVTANWTNAIWPSTDWSNQPGNDSNSQPVTVQVNPGPNPSSSCTEQVPNWNVKYAMADAASGNYADMTFGLTGGTSNDQDFMRFGDNPDIQVTFDVNPQAPSGLTTSPESHSAPYTGFTGCDTSSASPDWLGTADLGPGGDAGLTLSTSIAANVDDEPVRAEYNVWDQTDGHVAITQNPSNYYAPGGTEASTTKTPATFSLANGHEYEWTATAEVTGIPTGSDGPYTTAAASDCYFAADTSIPGTPSTSSNSYPPAGTEPDVEGAGGSGTFSFSAADQPPAGCSSGCLGAPVYAFEYWVGNPLPVVSGPITPGCPTATSPGFVLASNPNTSGQASTATSCSISISQWGDYTMYVAAIDEAGNVSQTGTYNFYVFAPQSTDVIPANVTGNGITDLLGTVTGSGADAGDLMVLPSNQDPQASPAVASPQNESPDGTAWSTFDVTHRGSMGGGTVDDLFALKGSKLYLYPNDGGGTGDQYDSSGDVVSIPGNWSDVSQILAPGDAWLPPSQQATSSSLPSLFTVVTNGSDGGDLYLYPGGSNDSLGTPIEVGAGGWSGMTLIAPGVVNGSLALWARDNATGALYSYPITIGSGQPTLNPGGGPVAATSGAVISGVSLPKSGYPAVTSSGDVANSSYPGLYAEDTSGQTPSGGSCATGCLWYYPGQSTSGGASPLSSTPIFDGVLDQPVSQLS